MKGVPAIYLGQIVNKQHFRTFIYAVGGDKKLVESWDEYEKHMESGLWFSTLEDALSRVPVEKPKRVRNKPVPLPVSEVPEETVTSMNLDAHVVKDDDFLPKTGD